MTCEQHQELITKVRGLVRAGRDGKVQELRTIGPNPQRLASLILGWSIQNVPKRVCPQAEAGQLGRLLWLNPFHRLDETDTSPRMEHART
jgi:hypothetical protein